MFHVQVGGQGFTSNVGTRFNLTAEEVEAQFAAPWHRDEAIVVQGRTFIPHDSNISIIEASELDDEDKRKITVWLELLQRGANVTDQFITQPPGSLTSRSTESRDTDPRMVAVIHGRDVEARQWLFGYLRALDLYPLEWVTLVQATKAGAPSTYDVVKELFKLAAAVIVLLTPDEVVALHPDLCPKPDPRGEGTARPAARPNVWLEAGMALAHHPERTIFVEIGATEVPTDIVGLNQVRLSGGPQPLHDLATRLETVGCQVNRAGSEWLELSVLQALGARDRSPVP